jgi:plastocyanin
MYFSQIAILALAAVAEAVDVQVVSVGRNSVTNATGLKFWPEKITAEPGTMVQFQFWAGNHTVTQSTFDDPCVPIGNVMSNVTGIYSGYQPVEASMSKGMIPTYTIMIKDKKPMWLFCSKAKHCQGGMSMVINENTSANATRSLNNYKSLCSSATVSEVVPIQGGGSPQGGNGGNDTNTGGAGGGSSGGGSGGDSSGGGSSSGDGSEDGSGTPTGVSAPGSTGTPTAGSSGDPVVTAAAAELKAPISMLLAVGAAAMYVL